MTSAKTLDAFAALLGRPPSVQEVVLALDPNDAFRANELRTTSGAKRTQALRAPDDVVKGYDAEQAESELNEFLEGVVTVTFSLKAIGQDNLDALQNAWPASDERLAKHRLAEDDPKATLDWDPDDFPPRMFSACCDGAVFSDGREIDTFTEDQAVEMWEAWPAFDLLELLGACYKVNQRNSKIDTLGKG